MTPLPGDVQILWALFTIFLAILISYILFLPFCIPRPKPKECCTTILLLMVMILFSFFTAILATVNYVTTLDNK